MDHSTNDETPGKTLTLAIRTYTPPDQELLLGILEDAFGKFADIPRARMALSSRRFDPRACFIADDDNIPKGWIAVTRLPRDKWFVIRYLSVSRSSPHSKVAERLLAEAMEHVEVENAEYVRATTPAIESYVETYRRYGFKPVRRDFRISWHVNEIPNREDPRIETPQVSEENIDQAGETFVRSLSPFWDWRTDEEGGPAVVANSLREDRARGAKWLLAKHDHRVLGVTGIIPDYYGSGIAWFRGAMVLPEYRGAGIGSLLMSRISEFAQKLGQTKMIVYTFSFLESLAPGGAPLSQNRRKNRGGVPSARPCITGLVGKIMHNPNIAF